MVRRNKGREVERIWKERECRVDKDFMVQKKVILSSGKNPLLVSSKSPFVENHEVEWLGWRSYRSIIIFWLQVLKGSRDNLLGHDQIHGANRHFVFTHCTSQQKESFTWISRDSLEDISQSKLQVGHAYVSGLSGPWSYPYSDNMTFHCQRVPSSFSIPIKSINSKIKKTGIPLK